MQPTSPTAGRLWILVAALLWSTSGLFAKAPIFAGWPADSRGVLLAFWRALFAALVLAAAVRRPRWQRDLVPLAISFAAMNAIYLTAMGLTTAANAIWTVVGAALILVGLAIRYSSKWSVASG